MAIRYYVATIDTYYSFTSLALSRERALELVALKAVDYLTSRQMYNQTPAHPHTVKSVLEYYQPKVTALFLDTAELEGEGVYDY